MRYHTDFFDKINHFENKSFGGCLFFAYVFWLWLKKNNMPRDNFHIFQLSHYDEKLQKNMKFLSTGNGDITADYHFLWEYDGKLFDCDCNGVALEPYSPVNMSIKKVSDGCSECNINKFLITAIKTGNWNESFKIEKAKNKLKKSLGISFDNINTLKAPWWSKLWQ